MEGVVWYRGGMGLVSLPELPVGHRRRGCKVSSPRNHVQHGGGLLLRDIKDPRIPTQRLHKNATP